MIGLIALLINSIIFPSQFVINADYNSDAEEPVATEEENSEDGVVLLAYNDSNKQGKLIQTSSTGEDMDEPGTDESEEESIESDCAEIMKKDFADMRIAQLGNSIADDLGVQARVSVNR